MHKLIGLIAAAAISIPVFGTPCEERLTLYHESVPGMEYPSGFVAPEKNSPEHTQLFQKVTSRLMEGPPAVKSYVRKLSLKEQIRWLHEFSYIEHMVTRTALDNEDPLMKTILANFSGYSTTIMNFTVKQITDRPSKALYPYFSELTVIITNLISFSGFEAILALESKFVEMSGEIPELRQHREMLTNGLLHNLARKSDRMTRTELRQFQKHLAEKMEMQEMKSNFVRLVWVSKYLMDSLSELQPESSDVFKEFVRTIVDVLPQSFDLQSQERDQDATDDILESMEEIFTNLLEAAEEIPGLLDPPRIAKVEFYRDGFAQLRRGSPSRRQ